MASIAKTQNRPAPPAPAPSGRLQQLNARHLRIREQLSKFGEEIASLEARETDPASKAREVLMQLVNSSEVTIKELDDASKFLERLHALRWEPPKPGPRVFKVGEKVAIRARHVEHFTRHGMYPEEVLRQLVVVSVHSAPDGGSAFAKVRTAKGEGLGAVNVGWLTPAEEVAAAK